MNQFYAPRPYPPPQSFAHPANAGTWNARPHAVYARLAEPSKSAPALYVIGSFLLMMLIAGVFSVTGPVVALVMLDAASDDPTEQQEPQDVKPAASLTTPAER